MSSLPNDLHRFEVSGRTEFSVKMQWMTNFTKESLKTSILLYVNGSIRKKYKGFR